MIIETNKFEFSIESGYLVRRERKTNIVQSFSLHDMGFTSTYNNDGQVFLLEIYPEYKEPIFITEDEITVGDLSKFSEELTRSK